MAERLVREAHSIALELGYDVPSLDDFLVGDPTTAAVATGSHDAVRADRPAADPARPTTVERARRRHRRRGTRRGGDFRPAAAGSRTRLTESRLSRVARVKPAQITEELNDVWRLVVGYAKQETTAPLRGIANFARCGFIGMTCFAIGSGFAALAILRALQDGDQRSVDGNLVLRAVSRAASSGCAIVLALAMRSVGAHTVEDRRQGRRQVTTAEAPRITRDDIETKLRQLKGDAEDVAGAQKSNGIDSRRRRRRGRARARRTSSAGARVRSGRRSWRSAASNAAASGDVGVP